MSKKITRTDWTGSGFPSGLSLDPKAGQIYGKPVAEAVSDVGVRVETNYGKAEGEIKIVAISTEEAPFIFDGQTLTLYEDSYNERQWLKGINILRNTGGPYITSPVKTVARLADTYTYQITESYRDPESHSYYASGPSGITVDSETGEVTWPVPATLNPNSTQQMTVGVTTTAGSFSQAVEIYILYPRDYYPAITSPTSTIEVTLGDIISYQIKARNNRNITYSVASNPAGAVVDQETGVVTWKVHQKTYHPSVTYSLTVGIQNLYGKTDTKTIPVTVLVPEYHKPVIDDDQSLELLEGVPVNYQVTGTNTTVNIGHPVLTSPTTGTVDVGSTLTYQITTSFVDDDKQVYSIESAPEGMTVDPVTGIVTMPVSKTATVGSAISFVAKIENSYSAVSQWVTFTLTAPSDYIPVITSPSSVLADLNSTFTYQVTTEVDDTEYMAYHISELENVPEGLTFDFNPATGILTGYIPDTGLIFTDTFQLTFSVTNSYRQTSSQTVKIGFNVPDSYKPQIADNQRIEAYENEAMEPYNVQGTNV